MTTIDQVTERDLLQALPRPLPVGYTSWGEATSGFSEASSTEGACGGPNASQLARDLGATVRVAYPAIHRRNLVLDLWFWITAYGFPTADSARDFVQSIAHSVESCPTDRYEVPHSAVQGYLDLSGVNDDHFTDDTMWSASLSTEILSRSSTNSLERLVFGLENDYHLLADDFAAGLRQTSFIRFQNFGSLVIYAGTALQHSYESCSGECQNFTLSESGPSGRIVTVEDLDSANVIIDSILRGLSRRGGWRLDSSM
jgi:hypothetical protein